MSHVWIKHAPSRHSVTSTWSSSDALTTCQPCVILFIQLDMLRKRGSRVVSALASCARGPGFNPRQRRGNFVGPNTLPFVSFAGMT